MKKFAFSLQRVLQVRQAEERNLQKDLAAVLQELSVARALEQATREKIQLEWLNLDRVKKEHNSSAQILLQREYISALDAFLLQTQQDIVQIQKRVDEARHKLVEKARERKVLEKLRENRQQEFKQEQNRLEQKAGDEAGQRLFAGGKA